MLFSQSLPGTQNTDLVTFTIKINGEAIGSQYQIANISIAKEVNRIPFAKLMIYDGDAAAQDFAISNEDTFKPGAEIEITAGYHSDETSLFAGIILKHSLQIRTNRSPLLILDCRDKMVKLTISRKNKYFYNTTDSDAAGSIIDEYNLQHDIEDTKVKLESLVQYDSTDWDFIVSRMEANGKLCFVDAGKLTAKSPDLSPKAVLDAVFGATMLEFDADLDARNQYQNLKAASWDDSNQAITSADAEEPNYEENGNLSSSDLSDVLSTAEYDVFAGEQLKDDELQSLANARLQKARLSRCRGRAKFRGYGEIAPGDCINIGGVGERFNGKVFVSGVRQEIVNGAWKTDVQFGLSDELFANKPDVTTALATSLLPAARGLQIGVVTALENDPESGDRIRVRLPIISENEDGIWCRVSTLDAGNNRGSFFRPEIRDEVIVAFLNNDPRHPVVLGMLNSSAKPAPLPASDQNDEKGFITRSGMKMIFNDADKSLKIETPAGKKVTISEANGVMKLEDENGNSITMDSSSVTIESAAAMSLKAATDLTIEAKNITVSASSSFSVSVGSTSISADSSSATVSATSVTINGQGTTAVKGGLVTIN